MKKLLYALVALGLVAGAFVLFLPTALHLAGLHPEFEGAPINLAGKRALIITTSHGILNAPGEETGDPTGVAASELTAPYYEFLDAGMKVDVASIEGGAIPIDPITLSRLMKSASDERYLADADFKAKVENSMKVSAVDATDYDIIFLAGGWGAAYDFAGSEALASLVSAAYGAAHQPVLSGVCHGPLGFIEARDDAGKVLVAGRAMTGATDKQIEEFGITVTPFHPEAELRKAGALFEAETALLDMFANHVVVDAERRFVTGQNQNSGAETAYEAMKVIKERNAISAGSAADQP